MFTFGGELHEQRASRVQARIRRLKRAAHHFCYLGHREPLDFVEDQDRALVLVEPVEQREERRARLNALVGSECARLREIACWVGVRALVPNARTPSSIRSNPQAYAVEPGSELRAPLERRKLAVNDDENLLRVVVELRFRNAEMSERPPDVRRVLIEHLP